MHSPGLGECLNAVSEVNLLLWRYLYGGITRGAAAIFIDGRRPVVSKIYFECRWESVSSLGKQDAPKAHLPQE